MMKNAPLFCLVLGLAACSSAEQKPENRWHVNVKTEGESKVWISRPDGSRQCAAKSAPLSLEQASNELQAAGVVIYQGKKGNDGLMRAQKCGSATGATIDLEIPRSDLSKAHALGYVSKTSRIE